MILDTVFASVQRSVGSLQRFRVTAPFVSFLREVRPLPPAAYPASTPHYDAELGLFTFKGTYRQMGRQFAEVFPPLKSLDGARHFLAKRKSVRGEISRATCLLEQWHPQMLDWLRGIVDDHQRYSIDEAVLAAFGSVLMDCAVPTSCSAVAFMSGDRPVIGQNLDLGRSCQLALARILPLDGSFKLARIVAGYPWVLSFVNRAGLVVCGSSINVNQAPVASGELLPQELLADFVLSRANTVAGGIELLNHIPPVGPLNGGLSLILGDSSGDIRQVEIAGDKLAANEPAHGLWITTNHFRHPDMSPLCEEHGWAGKRLLENSIARYDHAGRFFGDDFLGRRDPLTVLLRSNGGKGAWLRKAQWPDLGYTTASYIVDLNRRTIDYWIGAGADEPRHASIDRLLS